MDYTFAKKTYSESVKQTVMAWHNQDQQMVLCNDPEVKERCVFEERVLERRMQSLHALGSRLFKNCRGS